MIAIIQALTPLFVWSTERGIINWNQGCEKLYGYTTEEAIGQNSHKLLASSHPLPLDELMAILESDRIWTGELKHITRTGQQVIVESRLQLIETNGQKLILETNHDITDRKLAEQSLRESEERLRLGMQVAGFAIAKVDYTSNTVELSPEAASLYGLRWIRLGEMGRWVRLGEMGRWVRLGEMRRWVRLGEQENLKTQNSKLPQSPVPSPQSLLVVSREQIHATFHPEDRTKIAFAIDRALDPTGLGWFAIELSEPIEAALETVRLAAQAKSIQLKVLLDPEIGKVRGDAGRLQQVIWNLLSNAIKFTPAGGRVEVRLEFLSRKALEQGSSSLTPTPYPLTPSQESPKFAQITVTDTGKGIQPEFLPHVFELFRQQDSSTTRSFGGLGLGLAIARQVVEAHGGTITAQSPGEGQGATFTVQLPLIPALDSHAPDSRNHETLVLNNLRVLVVDDEADALELVKVILEQEGAIVQAVPLAPEALRLLTLSRFDLLISDIGMPEMNGYVLIRQVRTLPPESNRDILAIALTAYAGETNQNQALGAGFQVHLAKPIDPQQLLDAIRAALT